MQKNRSYAPVNALLRGLELLAEVGALGTAGVGELHKRTGIAKPTIVRNLETLEHAGYVARDAASGLYILTAKVLSLSSGYNCSRRLVDLASPILNEFRKSMPWPSDLALFDGEAMVILETNRDPGALALNRPVGTRLSVINSALGRAYLAFADEALRSSVLSNNFQSTPDGTKERSAFVAELTRFRQQGFSENDQSLSANTRGIGVPIIIDGAVVACINTIVLTEAMSMDEVVERCVQPLRAVAGKIADALIGDGVRGGNPEPLRQ